MLNVIDKDKKKIYVFLFTLFGVLLGLFISGMAQVIYFKLLYQDFVTYSFGLTWPELDQFMQMLGIVLVTVSGLWGYASGKYWWNQIYVLKRFGQKR